MKRRIFVVGTVGVPGEYGGFETLVENLLELFQVEDGIELSIFCSGKRFEDKIKRYKGANLIYLPLDANGIQSIVYDIFSFAIAVWRRADVVLVLGVSGTICLPMFKLFSNAKVVTNVDGMEWKRDKWNWLARKFLKYSEKFAVMFSDVVIADNNAIKKYIESEYGVSSELIAYGGDHALNAPEPDLQLEKQLPRKYAFSICRIEPENNVHLILDAFSCQESLPLFFVGNWDASEYGRILKQKYVDFKNINIVDPIYDINKLFIYRKNAYVYLHGHSAGGTNPSLVEAMHFGIPIIAYDCIFNRETTKNQALFFKTKDDIIHLIKMPLTVDVEKLKKLASTEYTWKIISKKYYRMLYSQSDRYAG